MFAGFRQFFFLIMGQRKKLEVSYNKAPTGQWKKLEVCYHKERTDSVQ